MMTFIDNYLNRITMYRLVLYYLLALLGAAAFFGFLKMMPYDPAVLAFSTLIILGTCWLINKAFAKTFEATTNVESVYITTLILALIISPVAPTNYIGVGFLVFASAWAMASKYIFAIGKKHIFNPAAFGVALAALTINQSATWWIGGNLTLLPIVLLGGLLVVRKLKRFDLVISFGLVALITAVVTSTSGNYFTPIYQTLLHSSLFFLAFVMLTEPLTMPPDRIRRILYGAFVGFLFAPNIHVGSFYTTPELALLLGNVFSYVISPKGRFMLTLLRKEEVADGIYEFVFQPDKAFPFRPGQYMEWTLGHKFPDNRGNRRYFTISSSPTEKEINLGVKLYSSPSSFKRTLLEMRTSDIISASQLSGDFVLPRNKNNKLVFIAGGIGVTPFRSMLQYMLDTKDKRPVTMLYSNKTAAEIAYKDVFDRAQKELGIKTIYAITDEKVQAPSVYNGFINGQLIVQEIPDYKERIFYISGPHGMVEAFKKTLTEMGVSRWKIKADYFPGFV